MREPHIFILAMGKHEFALGAGASHVKQPEILIAVPVGAFLALG